MRTTISIDEDVAKLLKSEMRRSGLSLKQAVNRFLRRGLMGGGGKRKGTRLKVPYFPPARILRQGMSGPDVLAMQHRLAELHYWIPAFTGTLSYDNVEELLEALEGKTHK